MTRKKKTEKTEVEKEEEAEKEPQYGQKGLGLEGILGGMQPKMSALMSPSRDLSWPKVNVTYSTDTKWLVTYSGYRPTLFMTTPILYVLFGVMYTGLLNITSIVLFHGTRAVK